MRTTPAIARTARVDPTIESPLAWMVGILGLCAMDGINTVTLLGRGAVELNPFMDLLLAHSIFGFFVVKLALTGVGLGVLLNLRHRTILGNVRVMTLVKGVFALYAVLILYEFVLLTTV